METSFPMRGASQVTLQPHEILRLPRKMNVINDLRHILMKPHFQCVEQVKSPSNLTKYCACHEILKLKISAETPWMLPPIERRFDDNPRISDHIRPYPTIKSSSRTRRFGDLPDPSWRRFLYCKIQHFALRLSPKSCACHEKSPSILTKYCACHTKINVINDLRHIWNVISNAWSK